MVLKPTNWIKHHVEWTQSGSNEVFNPAGLGMVWCEYQKFAKLVLHEAADARVWRTQIAARSRCG